MIYVGSKFYCYEEKKEEPTYYRFIGYQNENIIRLQNEETKKILKVTKDELENMFTMINFAGLIIINKVKICEKNDIMVSLYRQEEIEKNDGLPYCVCRQGVTDLHANVLADRYGKEYYGACISKETIPEGVNFNVMVACDGVYTKDTQAIAVYIDDTFDEIINLIKTKVYDQVLEQLFLEHLSYKSQQYGNLFYKEMIKADTYEGYCKTLKRLLEENNFMYDFYRAFNIVPTNFSLKEYDEKTLPYEYLDFISSMTGKNITEALAIKMGYDISLSTLQKDYVLISDINKELYIVAYKYDKRYRVPVENIESEENIEIMHNKMNSQSVQEAYDKIRFNKSKFI